MIGPGVEVGDAGLATWINDAYMYMIDEITEVRPEYFTKSSTTAIIENQQEYDLPDDWDKILLVNALYDGVWKRPKPMQNADIHGISIHSDTSSSQGFSIAQPYYYLIGDNIGLMPIPSTTTADGLKIWYVYTPTELFEDDDEPAFPVKYHHHIKYGAYANYLDQDDDHVAAERLRIRFDERIRRMTQSFSQQQIDEPKGVTIVENTDMYNG